MRVCVFVLGWCLLASEVGFGQTFGSIDGETRDSTGAIVAGVTVSVTNNGTNAVRSAVTNDAGVYSFPSLAPGTYGLRAEKPGFRTIVRSQVELQVQQAARVDFKSSSPINRTVARRYFSSTPATANPGFIARHKARSLTASGAASRG